MIINAEGYDKIKVSPEVFSSRLEREQKKNFRIEYIKEILPSEKYYFTYFGKIGGLEPDSRNNAMEFVCSQLDELRNKEQRQEGWKEMTVLTNIKIKEGEKKDFISYFYIKEHNLKVKLIHYKKLSAEEFEYLLLRSERIVGCTGDMSLTQVLSSNRIFIYEYLEHKGDLAYAMMDEWMSY